MNCLPFQMNFQWVGPAHFPFLKEVKIKELKNPSLLEQIPTCFPFYLFNVKTWPNMQK